MSTRQPSLVSCIVPAYNGDRYLGEALESILAQTYRQLEIIVVDDGSTDGTPELVASYGDRVRYVWQSNAGPAAARNRGLDMAQGEFVAFLDQDDLWHAEKCARQMARFELRPELHVCITHVQNFWIPELREEAERFRNHRFSRPFPGYTTQALLARRTLFDTVGRFNTALKLVDDMDWFLRVNQQGAIMEVLPDVLVFRRLHQANFSMQPGNCYMSSAMPDEFLQVVKMSLDRRRRREGKAQEPSGGGASRPVMGEPES